MCIEHRAALIGKTAVAVFNSEGRSLLSFFLCLSCELDVDRDLDRLIGNKVHVFTFSRPEFPAPSVSSPSCERHIPLSSSACVGSYSRLISSPTRFASLAGHTLMVANVQSTRSGEARPISSRRLSRKPMPWAVSFARHAALSFSGAWPTPPVPLRNPRGTRTIESLSH